MNLKIQSERLEGAEAIQNSSTAAGRRTPHSDGRVVQDSVQISGLSSKIAETISAADARTEKRVSELAALYASGNYRPDAAALGRALVSRALEPKEGVEL